MCTRFVDSTFAGHVRHQDLFDHFISALDSFNLKKLLQVSVDSPNVNKAFFLKLCNYRTENDMTKLLLTVSCGLHAIHGAFKTGEQSRDWKLKKVLRALHQILHDSPARQNDYADVTGSSRFHLPFCGTRWIEDEQVTKQFELLKFGMIYDICLLDILFKS